MFTEDIEIKYHHLNQTTQGKEALDYVKEQVLDKGIVSSEFRIIYENDDCAVTYVKNFWKILWWSSFNCSTVERK